MILLLSDIAVDCVNFDFEQLVKVHPHGVFGGFDCSDDFNLRSHSSVWYETMINDLLRFLTVATFDESSLVLEISEVWDGLIMRCRFVK